MSAESLFKKIELTAAVAVLSPLALTACSGDTGNESFDHSSQYIECASGSQSNWQPTPYGPSEQLAKALGTTVGRVASGQYGEVSCEPGLNLDSLANAAGLVEVDGSRTCLAVGLSESSESNKAYEVAVVCPAPAANS